MICVNCDICKQTNCKNLYVMDDEGRRFCRLLHPDYKVGMPFKNCFVPEDCEFRVIQLIVEPFECSFGNGDPCPNCEYYNSKKDLDEYKELERKIQWKRYYKLTGGKK